MTTLRLATQADDAVIRSLLRHNGMQSWVEVREELLRRRVKPIGRNDVIRKGRAVEVLPIKGNRLRVVNLVLRT